MKITASEIMIEGAVGAIECILDLPEVLITPATIAVNCHPHSLHGGSMTNKVVHTVSRTIASQGIPSIRFNFRGVGQSAGEYDQGLGEQQDLAKVVDFMKNRFPHAKLIISGFSFGAFVSSFAASTLIPDLLLSVAPPVKRFDFDGFKRPPCDWAIIMGDADELVAFQSVLDWINSFTEKPDLVVMKEASHFFHGRLVELKENVEQLLSRYNLGSGA